ncbi:hypothetical protein EB796_004722 [Bugula neritina]|uniref:Uncharacterized protein n=1 Tax=Bugula neritina TaxID=10212 RepID=A0A7J7KH38_BUGNE|nr:hypothetical protein EB796_004722 [Bugula neritina]
MKQLLANGARVNIQDITGSTPVRKAAYKGHLEAVRHLLGNGANANIRTKKGRAAVHCAALYGHTEVLDLLLQHGAQVNIQLTTSIYCSLMYPSRNQLQRLAAAL